MQFLIQNIKQTQISLISLIMLVSITLNCGKRQLPQPPVEKVNQRLDIFGTQVGNKIKLKWQMPSKKELDGSFISRVDIYRLAEPLNTPLSLTESEFVSRSAIIDSIPLNESDFTVSEKTYVDTLRFIGQEVRLRYAIRLVDAAGRKASFSNFFLIEPASKLAGSPTSLKSEVTQNAVRLTWDAPSSNIDGSKSPDILGYNIYRLIEKGAIFKRLNTSPSKTTTFSDVFFEFETQYKYLVRAVSLGKNGQFIESDASNTIKVIPKDTFPPNAPSAITIASTPSSISIFFATNLEKDVIGYKVYRTTNANLPKSQWKLLTPQKIKINTFQDVEVESGKTYYYYLTAVDKFGNVSDFSKVVSERTM